MEIWKKIEGFENYEVSNLGKVKRKKCRIEYANGNLCNYPTKILKPDLNKGYHRVTLSEKNKQQRFLLHRLVAMAFIENKELKLFVNHINGIKTDNRVENLEWCTASENENHSYKVLGKINNNRKLTSWQVLFIRKSAIPGKGGNTRYLSKMFNVDISTIQNVIKSAYYAD